MESNKWSLDYGAKWGDDVGLTIAPPRARIVKSNHNTTARMRRIMKNTLKELKVQRVQIGKAIRANDIAIDRLFRAEDKLFATRNKIENQIHVLETGA